MNPETYLPFNLETALKHPERVICRNGHKPEWHYFKSSKEKYPILCICSNGRSSLLTERGFFHSDKSASDHDLFLLPPPEKVYWVNVYSDGDIYTGGCHESEQEAREETVKETWSDYIKTISFTVPDEG